MGKSDEIFTDTWRINHAIPSDPTVVGVELSENILHLFSLEMRMEKQI